MRIVIIGGGVSGLVCAHALHPRHEITLLEADDRLGGHSHTHVVRHEGRDIAVDTGFIVYNERNYPHFTRLLRELGVSTKPAAMSFSVHDERDGFEYGGHSLAGLLAQPGNLLRPRFLRTVRDIGRIGRLGPRLLEDVGERETLGELAARWRLSSDFVESYLVPMGAAIWSAPRAAMREFPARFFLAFFENHGMLNLAQRPQWRTIEGGSREYVRRMAAPFVDRCVLGARVAHVARSADGVTIVCRDGRVFEGDEVVLACHTDQALGLLADATAAERAILGAIPYQANEAVLHWDVRSLPRRRAAWSAWNYRLGANAAAPVSITYHMGLLQSIDGRAPLLVTLNPAPGAIDDAKAYARMTYHHPVFTVEGMSARARHAEISGVNRTHYCGAAWFNGFHEDGVRSALRVAEMIGRGARVEPRRATVGAGSGV